MTLAIARRRIRLGTSRLGLCAGQIAPCARDINRRKRARCPVLATLVPCHYTSKEQREKSMEMFFLPDANGETSSLTTICYEHESNVYIYISLCVLHSCERSYDDYIG